MTPASMGDDAMDPERVKKLQQELEEAQETLRAIRQGEADALVVEGPLGPQLFTLKSAEQPYRMLVEQMQEGAVTLTPAGDVVYCNRRFAELVGVGPEAVVGGPIARFVAPADRALLDAALQAGRGRHEGHLLGIEDRLIPALFSVGTFVAEGVESVSLVVTDLIELTRTRVARAEAEAASQAKDQFLAMLGHELRNPLGAISSAVSVLGQSTTPEHTRRARSVIAHQTEHLTRLVGDLLDVTRGALGKIELVRTTIEVAAAVRQCIVTLESTERLARHVLTVEAEPVWVQADKARIEQIVMNLLSNALKFTPEGGRITVRVGREGDEAVLKVSDDGDGMTADLLPSVFDLFVQGEGEPDRRSGLGIGLTLVRRLVELHGGRVEAASPGPGRGSVFTVRLPALVDPAHEDARAAKAPDAPRRQRILIIEDNVDNREMMRILLETSGNEIYEAPDGVSGVEMTIQLQPDTVLIDIGLPGIDGYEVARQIRSKLRDRSRLIALSGYGQEKDRQRAFEAGFNDHLLKPVDPARLLAILSAPSDRR
ncbi:MAG TPA: hybrid sensor histidine kinase/response regulator [Methylomirabilota bacterium]|nr:hybrid sensor histidine kinase/response regulator [Methylomirabilota bacterium]